MYVSGARQEISRACSILANDTYFAPFAAGDGFAPEMVAEWAVKRGLKPEARKPR